MSMHTQLLRGLFALPVAALLIVAGALAPTHVSLPVVADSAELASPVALPRTVEFHSMLPGALHIVKRVKVAGT